MRLVDTHAHLNFPQFNPDRSELIDQLARSGIGVIAISTTIESIVEVVELATKHAHIWGMIGIHPTDVGVDTVTQLPGLLEAWAKILDQNPKIVGLGEVGLDYFHHNSSENSSRQKAVLRSFLTVAKERDLPASFHCREAYGDLLTILEEFKGIRGVVHCYSGSQAQAEAFMKLGLHISFTAIITYPKNEALGLIAKTMPLDRLLLETDSPFLPPQGRRGERNDPLTVKVVAEHIALLRGQTVEVIAEATTQNAMTLFGLKETY